MIGISDRRILERKVSKWSPFLWRSYKLRRAVGSSMGAEAIASLDVLGMLEWTLCFLLELWGPRFKLEQREE